MIWYLLVAITCLILGSIAGSLLSARAAGTTSVTIIRISSVIGLSILMKCIENYSYANLVKLEAMRKSGIEIEDRVYKIEKQNQAKIMNNFKENSIQYLVNEHKGLFKEALPYSDWRSAMRFLENNKKLAILFRKGAES